MPDLPQAWRAGFDEVAELYDRVRPCYPDELFDDLAAALPRSPVIVEVGPGTGQATQGLVARGASVTAVELGAHLAAVLARNLPTVDIVIGPFENVGLAPGSFDAVVAASSYHWVPPEARMTRPAALLRPGGHLALIALNQVASPADRGFFDEVHHVFMFTEVESLIDSHYDGWIVRPLTARSCWLAAADDRRRRTSTTLQETFGRTGQATPAVDGTPTPKCQSGTPDNAQGSSRSSEPIPCRRTKPSAVLGNRARDRVNLTSHTLRPASEVPVDVAADWCPGPRP